MLVQICPYKKSLIETRLVVIIMEADFSRSMQGNSLYGRIDNPVKHLCRIFLLKYFHYRYLAES